jgi:hypothetical protein
MAASGASRLIDSVGGTGESSSRRRYRRIQLTSGHRMMTWRKTKKMPSTSTPRITASSCGVCSKMRNRSSCRKKASPATPARNSSMRMR